MLEALGSSWARCHARRNDVDRPVEVAAVEPQLGVDRQAQLRLVAAGELTGDHRGHELERPGRIGHQDEPGLLAQLARLAVAAAVPRVGQPGGELAVGGLGVADGLREPSAGRVHGPQVVAVAAEDLLHVVDGRHEGVEADLRQVLDEVDGPLQPPQHGVTVVLDQATGSGSSACRNQAKCTRVCGSLGVQ